MKRHPLRRRTAIAGPHTTPRARSYCIREVGVLAEQGVLDRARMLIERRVRTEPVAPDAFLDAIRLEHSVPSSGSAWRAWLARALEGGVEIADRLATIIPERELAKGLAEISPAVLMRQASRAQALDLLRARAALLLAENDASALDVADAELLEAGAHEPELRELQLAVLLARALAEPEAVDRCRAALAPALEPEQAALLLREVELARAYRRLALFGRLPALDAALALMGRCDAELDRTLRENLGRDLRARPSDYLAWAEAAAAEPALLDALCGRAEGASAAADPEVAPLAAALAAELARAIESDALRFVPLAASELSLYRKHARPKALSAIAAQTTGFEALATALREHKGSARRALAHLAGDEPLRLVDRVARLAAT